MKLSELEIKIKIGSEEQFRKVFEKCETYFGPPISHFLQLDEYYDTVEGHLRKQDLVIRIRTTDDKKTIALKSPRIELASGMSERVELEFVAAEGDKVRDQLLKQGLNPHEAAEKERWSFVYRECEIVLDKLPFIGSFIEIEGPSEAVINGVVQMLELSKAEVIRQNYGELIKAKFLELKLPISNIRATFEKEKEYKHESNWKVECD